MADIKVMDGMELSEDEEIFEETLEELTGGVEDDEDDVQ